MWTPAVLDRKKTNEIRIGNSVGIEIENRDLPNRFGDSKWNGNVRILSNTEAVTCLSESLSQTSNLAPSEHHTFSPESVIVIAISETLPSSRINPF